MEEMFMGYIITAFSMIMTGIVNILNATIVSLVLILIGTLMLFVPTVLANKNSTTKDRKSDSDADITTENNNQMVS